ncbi:MAG: M18 family aminopeptidase [Proteobacteria bacterium]|nr:M18 family aminopeptidase [Pseudomonadota bacterium]
MARPNPKTPTERSGMSAELLLFLQHSPTPFHAVTNMARMLDESGYQRLDEAGHWKLKKSARYYVVRNESALIAFNTGTQELLSSGIRLAGAHTDSPCLKIKPNPEIAKLGYLQLGAEVCGGALLNPWFDRDLSIAGRVHFSTRKGELGSALIDLKKPVAFVPSLAIHLDREVNKGRNINAQKELVPLVLQLDKEERFSLDELLLATLQEQMGKNLKSNAAWQVLSHELLLYDTQAPQLVGLREQFVASARLDNLLSCFLACRALIASNPKQASALVCNDHEEVGSASTAGAQGPFLKSVVDRWLSNFHSEADSFERATHQSLFLSIDNAHGVHPNFSEKHDDNHQPLLNAGPVIKVNANQRYASNSQSIALFKSICNKLSIPYQQFVMRSDMACGSTIGPLTATAMGITTVDIGIASFGMHSIRELAGIEDVESTYQVVNAYFNR